MSSVLPGTSYASLIEFTDSTNTVQSVWKNAIAKDKTHRIVYKKKIIIITPSNHTHIPYKRRYCFGARTSHWDLLFFVFVFFFLFEMLRRVFFECMQFAERIFKHSSHIQLIYSLQQSSHTNSSGFLTAKNEDWWNTAKMLQNALKMMKKKKKIRSLNRLASFNSHHITTMHLGAIAWSAWVINENNTYLKLNEWPDKLCDNLIKMKRTQKWKQHFFRSFVLLLLLIRQDLRNWIRSEWNEWLNNALARNRLEHIKGKMIDIKELRRREHHMLALSGCGGSSNGCSNEFWTSLRIVTDWWNTESKIMHSK